MKRSPGFTRAACLVVFLSASASMFAGCHPSNSSDALTQLSIELLPDGKSISQSFDLVCIDDSAADQSTLPNADQACELLAQQPEILRGKDNPGQMCTEIYGGPQRAQITGTLRGEAVNRDFSRHNGCAIDLWERASILFAGMSTGV